MSMSRRTLLAATAASLTVPSLARAVVETRDGQSLFTVDKGAGRPVVFIHGWTLSSAFWKAQTDFVAVNGLRAIAYDRRGHGQSSKPESGYDYDRLAGDLATVLERLDLRDVVLVGHSMGSGEVVRYLARHGTSRVGRVVLVAPTTPYQLKTADNPQGVDRALYDKMVDALQANRTAYLASGAPGLLGRNAEPAQVEWAMSIALQASLPAQIGCLRALVETDFRAELAAVRVPTLILYGTADSPITPVNAQRTQAGIAGSRVEIYEGAPHALFVTGRTASTGICWRSRGAEDPMEAIYRVDGTASGGAVSVETRAYAGGPWDPKMQHGAAPSSLISWAVEQLPSPVPMRVARLTVDLMRPVPVGPLTIDTEIVREGKKIQLIAIRLLSAGKEVVRASALRIRKQAETLPVESPYPALDLPLPDEGGDAMAGAMSNTPFLSGLTARNVKGTFGKAGPAAIWFNAARPMVEGAATSPLMRAAIAADFCNGTSSLLDFRQWTFINGDLTVSLARDPVGEWILLDAETWAGPDSMGIAAARLADRQGYFGRAVQSVLFEKR